MATLRIKVEGTRPLLMHAAALADPLNPYSKQIKAIKANRRRTDADEELAAQLEWEGGLYYDTEDGLGPYIPGVNLEAVIKESARKWRKGKDVERGVMVTEEKVRLDYKGPRELAELKADGHFRDVRSARMPSTGARVIRARPRFSEPWTLTFTVEFDPRTIEKKDLLAILERAGEDIGLGDWRPRYGTFAVREVN